jgi:hypothetical protein
MPKVNIILDRSEIMSQNLVVKINKNMKKIKMYMAEKLSCTDMNLSDENISIRIIDAINGSGMIAPVEIDINAYNFSERAKNKDVISADLAKYFQDEIFQSEEKPSVLLILSELGSG